MEIKGDKDPIVDERIRYIKERFNIIGPVNALTREQLINSLNEQTQELWKLPVNVEDLTANKYKFTPTSYLVNLSFNVLDTKQKILWLFQYLKRQPLSIQTKWAQKIQEQFNLKKGSTFPSIWTILLYEETPTLTEIEKNGILGSFSPTQGVYGGVNSNQVMNYSWKFHNNSESVKWSVLYLLNRYPWKRTSDNPYYIGTVVFK